MTDLSTPEKRAALKARGDAYTHKITPGKFLGFRKLASGGTWLAKRRKTGESATFYPIGPENDYTFEEALAKALELLKLEPGQVVAPTKLNLAMILSSYLTYRLNQTEWKGAKSTQSLFNTHVFGHPIASQLVMGLREADYQKWLHDTGDRLEANHRDPDPMERRRKAHYTANQTWGFMEAALNRAHKTNKDLPKEEWQGVELLKEGVTVSRPAFMTEREVQRLINAASGAFRDLLLGGALTGARLGELTHMQVRDINFGEGVWTPSHSKTKRGKRPRYLDQPTLDLLTRLCAGKRPTDLVFVHDDGEPWRGRYQRLMKLAVERAGLDPRINFYSIRHSFISRQLKAGVLSQVIAENCGTSIKQIEDFYGHSKPDEKREQLARGAFRLETTESNVARLG